MKRSGLVLLAWLGLILAGCTPFTESAQPAQSNFLTLQSGQTTGQTFVAHYDGLSGVGLFIIPGPNSTGTLHLELYQSVGAPQSLRQVEIPLTSSRSDRMTVFYFPPISNSNQNDFYFSLSLEGNGSIQVGAANAGAYLDGAQYLDGQPQDAQLNFQLVYGRRMLLAGFIEEGLRWFIWTLAGVFLFILPGWALLDLLYPG